MVSVIVVDDDRDVIEAFTEFLQVKGINVVGIGHNGKDAVDLYKIHKPDVVLLDVMMPMYDGFYALEHIRAYDPNAKVIMVTADLTQSTEERLIELKASAITYKPYEMDDVLDTIDKVNSGKILLQSAFI